MPTVDLNNGILTFLNSLYLCLTLTATLGEARGSQKFLPFQNPWHPQVLTCIVPLRRPPGKYVKVVAVIYHKPGPPIINNGDIYDFQCSIGRVFLSDGAVTNSYHLFYPFLIELLHETEKFNWEIVFRPMGTSFPIIFYSNIMLMGGDLSSGGPLAEKTWTTIEKCFSFFCGHSVVVLEYSYVCFVPQGSFWA